MQLLVDNFISTGTNLLSRGCYSLSQGLTGGRSFYAYTPSVALNNLEFRTVSVFMAFILFWIYKAAV
jgi:hypothetical protein